MGHPRAACNRSMFNSLRILFIIFCDTPAQCIVWTTHPSTNSRLPPTLPQDTCTFSPLLPYFTPIPPKYFISWHLCRRATGFTIQQQARAICYGKRRILSSGYQYSRLPIVHRNKHYGQWKWKASTFNCLQYIEFQAKYHQLHIGYFHVHIFVFHP